MTYSLVSMPVLGFDLCRLPHGGDVADILLATLQLTGEDLAVVAARHPGAGRVARLGRVRRAGPPRPALASKLRAVGDGAPSLAHSAELAETLERSMIGSLDALLALAGDEILDWTWLGSGPDRIQDPVAAAALDVITDALAAGYCSEVLPPGMAADLAAPWNGAEISGRTPDLGPAAGVVERLLMRVEHLGPDGVGRLRALVAARHTGPATWARAAHDASWAVYLSGRLRPAARAQLMTVRAFARAGFTARDGAYGVWNSLSGLVQSVVVGDVLDPEAAATLRRDWLDAGGEI